MRERKPIALKVEIDGVTVERLAELRVLEYGNDGRPVISCMAPVLEQGEILIERVGMIPMIVRAPGMDVSPSPSRATQVTSYRDHIVRSVFGQRPALLFQETDRQALARICERLADAEDAHRILRSKGYGKSWLTLTELARLLPDAKRRDIEAC